MRDDERTYSNAADRVDVARGVPTDRVRWGPVLAGAFAAMTALAVLSTLGVAVGLSTYDTGDNPRNFAIGAGIWGIITMLLSFFFGGWIAARSSAIHGGDNGMLNGFLVAAIGIPLLLFLVGSASLLAGNAAANSTQNDRVVARGQMDGNSNQAVLASDTNRASGNNSVADGSSANRSQNRDDEVRTARRTAWSTLISLILAIGAASFAGLIGARDDNRTIRRDTTQGTVVP